MPSVLGTSALAEVAGAITDFFEKLAGSDGTLWLAAFKRFLRRENPWASVLTFLHTIAVGAVEKFVAKDHFTKENKKVKFWYFGENFVKHFLGKIEEVVPVGNIAIHRLEKASRDPEIMVELGSEKRVIKLAHFCQLIEAQGQGQEGPLLVNGWANIAYIEDDEGIVWAVYAYWNAGLGWGVDAFSVENPNGWNAGRQVLSQVA